jgi:phosphoribosylglycinamide formyltransferase-1
MNIAVLISGAGSNLQAIIDACARQTIQGRVSLVLSNKPAVTGLDRAADAGLDSVVVDHRDFADRESFDQALVTALESHRPDLVILAGFMRILTPVFIGRYQGRLLNIHPSLLPKYPGLHTHQRALDAGDDWTGATVHFVTEELDGGPPIVFARVPINAGSTADTLAREVRRREHRIYPLAAKWFCEGRLALEDDRAVLDGQVLPMNGLDADDIVVD